MTFFFSMVDYHSTQMGCCRVKVIAHVAKEKVKLWAQHRNCSHVTMEHIWTGPWLIMQVATAAPVVSITAIVIFWSFWYLILQQFYQVCWHALQFICQPASISFYARSLIIFLFNSNLQHEFIHIERPSIWSSVGLHELFFPLQFKLATWVYLDWKACHLIICWVI